MNRRLQRRAFLAGTSFAVPTLTLLKHASASPLSASLAPADGVHDAFPTQPAELVRETVLVAHGNLDRLKELVDATPTLARASWDWGFGDWESTLGAASHMGRKDIAEYLLEKGARPNLFSAAMLGQLPVVRAFVEASPGVQGILGPHGITLLSHAKAGGTRAGAVVEYLETVGGADQRLEGVEIEEEARKIYLGNYSFGTGTADTLTVQEGRFGMTLGRGTGTGAGRPLLYRGEHTFFPASSPQVRIRFQVADGKAIRIEIDSAEMSLTAERVD